MKYLLMLSMISLAGTVLAQKNKTYNLLVGTYTKPGKSEGIYVYTFDTSSGKLTPKSKATGIQNPSYLTISRNRKHIYAVNETNEGGVSAFKFDGKSGQLSLLNTVSSGGNGPCYISTDDRGRFAFVGNYGGGSI